MKSVFQYFLLRVLDVIDSELHIPNQTYHYKNFDERFRFSIDKKSNYLVVGRDDGSGCSSQRQNPASFGFSDRKFGGRIL